MQRDRLIRAIRQQSHLSDEDRSENNRSIYVLHSFLPDTADTAEETSTDEPLTPDEGIDDMIEVDAKIWRPIDLP